MNALLLVSPRQVVARFESGRTQQALGKGEALASTITPQQAKAAGITLRTHRLIDSSTHRMLIFGSLRTELHKKKSSKDRFLQQYKCFGNIAARFQPRHFALPSRAPHNTKPLPSSPAQGTTKVALSAERPRSSFFYSTTKLTSFSLSSRGGHPLAARRDTIRPPHFAIAIALACVGLKSYYNAICKLSPPPSTLNRTPPTPNRTSTCSLAVPIT